MRGTSSQQIKTVNYAIGSHLNGTFKACQIVRNILKLEFVHFFQNNGYFNYVVCICCYQKMTRILRMTSTVLFLQHFKIFRADMTNKNFMLICRKLTRLWNTCTQISCKRQLIVISEILKYRLWMQLLSGHPPDTMTDSRPLVYVARG